jgi:arylsulfatase A-like enzyme
MQTMNRRDFLRMTAGVVGATTLGSEAFAKSAQAEKRPNIVIIMADDLGFSDIGCYGGEIHTPNLDRLASEGLRFRQFYNAARCCPTRASLLTGLYPHQAGMGDMVSFPEQNRKPGPYQGYLNNQCVTIAEVLKTAGYRTYMSGKWHVGEARECWPRKRGFDRYFGIISGGSSYWKLDQVDPRPRVMALDDESYVPSGDKFYMTDAFTDHAVQFIDEHKSKDDPFFLYLAYTSPHWPIHAWPEDIAKYKGRYDGGWDALRLERHKRMIEMGVVDAKWPLSPRDPDVPAWSDLSGPSDKSDKSLRMAVYAAMIDRMDQGIGRVLDALKRAGADENTLVLFLSDNGGCHEMVENRILHTPGTKSGERGSFLSYQRSWANASNTPFRMFKHWTHEGGISTPLIARWPARIKQRGEFTDQVGHVIDFMATCSELAGAKYPTAHNGQEIVPLEGKSLVPVLEGRRRKGHDAIYWAHEGNNAIREGKWKLVMAKDGPWELYDLEADRTELREESGTNQRKARRLLEKWIVWADQRGVKITG